MESANQPDQKNSRSHRRRELRKLNQSVWEGSTVAENLDTTLKKNTAFIKRCRVGLVEDQQATLLKEVATLSLDKYLSEIVADLTEGLSKCKSSADLFTGVEVTSALFQRFGPRFSAAMLSNFLRSISNPSKASLNALTQEARAKEETSRTDRHKIVLRVLIELWLVGVFRYSTDPKQLGFEVPSYALRKSTSGVVLVPPFSALQEVLDYDMQDFSTASIAIMVLKNYGNILLGLNRNKPSPDAESKDDGTTNTDDALTSLVSPDVKELFSSLFMIYGTTFQARIIDLAKNLRRLERRNENAFIKTGLILDERKVEYDELMRKAEEMQANCRTLSDILNLEMPELRFTNETAEEIMIRKGGTVFGKDDVGIWDDDEQRKFYEDIVDLSKISRSEEDDSEAGKEEGKEGNESEENGQENPEEEEEDEAEFDSSDEESEDEDKDMLDELDALMNKPAEQESQETSTLQEYMYQNQPPTGGSGQQTRRNPQETPTTREDTYQKQPPIGGFDQQTRKTPQAKETGNANADGDDEEDDEEGEGSVALEDKAIDPAEMTAGSQIQALLLKISERTSRESIDNAAYEFIYLNNKASRNRVVKFLTEIPLSDQYKLPFYARFIAALNTICPDVTERVIEYLDSFFRYLQRKRKVKALFERRMFNIRYISELTKFGLVPKHVIFNKFKAMTERLDESNAFNVSTLLEGCGRYLLRKPETNVLMTKMLQVLESQKTARYLSVDQKLLIEGAMTYVKPPPEAFVAVKVKERSVIERFIRELIYVQLSKESCKSILKLLKKLDWSDADTYNALKKVFTKIHKVRFSNVPSIAWLLCSLVVDYQSFVIYVIDATFENIRRGLEISSYTMNQQRLAQVKYLSELFSYGMVDVDVIYETLYLFLTFGHPKGKPIAGVYAPLDPPNDFFRIRLVCTLLETPKVGNLLDQNGKEKLDLFLAFFQYYFFTKDKLSMDIEFQVRDTFKLLRPNLRLHDQPEDAQRSLDRAIARANGEEVPDDDSEQSSASEKEVFIEEDGSEYDRSKYKVRKEPAKVEVEKKQETEPPEVRAAREERERQLKEERDKLIAQKKDVRAVNEIEREFKKLMMDRVDSGVVNNAESRRQFTIFDAPVPSTKTSGSTTPNNAEGDKVSYTLLTKKGSKQETRAMSVPSDAAFAQSVAQKQEERRAEHDRIKESVLKYLDREDSSSQESLQRINQPKLQRYKYREHNRRL
ncbi:hypothetical protein TRICI_000395 [Trichomonascus ciferrii]|uniref:MIF4G domain-containing protein n=1 Tax=Trichomonascus ciferrii TaxID=44093 RepID=A0A642VDJ0_9ASCO|nr:hypothetical protein TRICI_000395 [Trichomonascus ciferrii]